MFGFFSGKAKEREVASILIQMIQMMRQAESQFGKGKFVSMLKRHPFLSTWHEENSGRGVDHLFYFNGQLEGFQFSARDEAGQWDINIGGNKEHAGFYLHASLEKDYLASYCGPTLLIPATKKAKLLHEVFVEEFSAMDNSNLY